MPYISPISRDALRRGDSPKTVGDLNYIISLKYIEMLAEDFKYETFHRLYEYFVIGADGNVYLKAMYRENGQFTFAAIKTAAALAFFELYDRIARRYEDLKRQENGDIYGSLLSILDGMNVSSKKPIKAIEISKKLDLHKREEKLKELGFDFNKPITKVDKGAVYLFTQED